MTVLASYGKKSFATLQRNRRASLSEEQREREKGKGKEGGVMSATKERGGDKGRGKKKVLWLRLSRE